jgi:serine protease Do
MSLRVLLLLGAALPGAAGADVDIGLFHKLAPSVVKIEAHGNGRTAIGSGVVVAPGAIVTNCHVTRDAERIDIAKGGARWNVFKQASDVKHDVCILFSPNANAPVVEIARHRPKVAQTVVALGYVGGLGPRFSGGEVKAIYDFDGGQVIQSSAAFNAGASGGGLFDDEGRLIGLITFKNRQREAYHFSLPVNWILDSLEKSASQDVAPLPSELPFWQQTYSEQPYFLRAATLESEEKWNDLLNLSRTWTRDEKTNANAWLMLGHAYSKLKQEAPAIDAYLHALELSSDYPEAWYALGASYARSGNKKEAAEAHRTLVTLDRNLAEDFSKKFLPQ